MVNQDEDDQSRPRRVDTDAALGLSPHVHQRRCALHRAGVAGDWAESRADGPRLGVTGVADVARELATRVIGGNDTHAGGAYGALVGAGYWREN